MQRGWWTQRHEVCLKMVVCGSLHNVVMEFEGVRERGEYAGGRDE